MIIDLVLVQLVGFLESALLFAHYIHNTLMLTVVIVGCVDTASGSFQMALLIPALHKTTLGLAEVLAVL